MNVNSIPKTPRRLSDPARRIIADVYLVGSVDAEAQNILKDVSRSVSIVGRLLNGLAGEYAAANKGLAHMLTVAGSVLWGIVEISVPESALFYLARNWFKLAAALGALIVVLGVAMNIAGMPSVGIDFLVGVFIVYMLSGFFHRCMNSGSVRMRELKRTLFLILAPLALLGALYLLIVHAQDIAATLQHMAGFFTRVAKFFHWLC